MNILMLTDVYFPRVNGVSTSIRTYARHLVQHGHRATVVAPDYGAGSGQDAYAHDGFDVQRLPARTIFFDPEDRLIRAAALHAVRPQLAAQPWDVIHVHTPFRAHQLGVRLARSTGRPIIETYHTYFEQYVGHYLPWLPAPLLRLFARRASRALCHAVDHLIVPSRHMADVLAGYGVRTAATVLPTGIDLAEFAGGDGARFRARRDIASGRPVLVTVSRLALEKNIDFLLRVVAALVPQFPDLLFVIAGEGPAAGALQRTVGELGLQANVRFFGNLDRRTELLDCYRAADLFVFASPTETQGLVLIEAMALGVPIVSTAVMGTATVLEHARSARISAERIDAFAADVARLLRDPAQRSVLAHAGPLDAQAWSTDRLMDQAIALYARLALADRGATEPLVNA